jgi:hypothetical protein
VSPYCLVKDVSVFKNAICGLGVIGISLYCSRQDEAMTITNNTINNLIIVFILFEIKCL